MDPRVAALIAAGLSRRTAYRRSAAGDPTLDLRIPRPTPQIGGELAARLEAMWGPVRAEWARRLGTTPRQLRRWLVAGVLPADREAAIPGSPHHGTDVTGANRVPG